jgi:hypothetical protein
MAFFTHNGGSSSMLQLASLSPSLNPTSDWSFLCQKKFEKLRKCDQMGRNIETEKVKSIKYKKVMHFSGNWLKMQ